VVEVALVDEASEEQIRQGLVEAILPYQLEVV
jgi:hypothetical protein